MAWVGEELDTPVVPWDSNPYPVAAPCSFHKPEEGLLAEAVEAHLGTTVFHMDFDLEEEGAAVAS